MDHSLDTGLTLFDALDQTASGMLDVSIGASSPSVEIPNLHIGTLGTPMFMGDSGFSEAAGPSEAAATAPAMLREKTPAAKEARRETDSEASLRHETSKAVNKWVFVNFPSRMVH